MNDKRIKLMSKAPVTEAILKLSLPVVMGMMVQVFYNLVDTFFIGRLGDPNQLAAANLTTPIFMMMMAIAGIVGTGAASYISRSLGSKDYDTANQTLSLSILIIGVLAAIVTIAGMIFLSPLVRSLGASPEVYPYAKDYGLYLFIGSIFIMSNYAIGQLLRSEGAAMPSITGMMIGTVLNIVLDPIFIFVFGMGVKGAAIATVIGNAAGVLYYIYYYKTGKTLVKFEISAIKFKASIIKEIFGIGLPASLSQLLMSVAMIISNNIAAGYGDVVVAGIGVSFKIMTIGTFVFMGFAAGCQPLTGFNYGAGNYSRVNEILVKGLLLTTGIGAVLSLAFGIFARPLIGVFASDMPQVIDKGVQILNAMKWSLIVLGGQMLANTTIQAFGKAKAALFLSILRQGVFFIPSLFILNAAWGFQGFIYAQPTADVLTTSVAILVLYNIVKNTEKTNKGSLKPQTENS